MVGAAIAAGTNKDKPKAGVAAAKTKAKAQAARGGGAGHAPAQPARRRIRLPRADGRADSDEPAGRKTLAQIAGSTNGKSVDGLVAALVTAEKTELAAKVTAGKLTQAQADAIIPTLTATFTAFVNGTAGPHGADGPRGGHGGPGGPGGHSDELDAESRTSG